MYMTQHTWLSGAGRIGYRERSIILGLRKTLVQYGYLYSYTIGPDVLPGGIAQSRS